VQDEKEGSVHILLAVPNPLPLEVSPAGITETWTNKVANSNEKRDNGGVYMSAEILTTLLTGLGLLLTFAAAFGWLILRMDAFRTELKDDMGALRTELKEDIGTLRTELKGEIQSLRGDLTTTNRELSEMRVSVARLEGPIRPGLIRPN